MTGNALRAEPRFDKLIIPSSNAVPDPIMKPYKERAATVLFLYVTCGAMTLYQPLRYMYTNRTKNLQLVGGYS